MKTIFKNFKNVFVATILVAGSVGLNSCSSDDDVPTTKPCTTICKNGGTVKPDCGCDCPIGFTGSNCETKKEFKVIVEKITVTRFPGKKQDGSNWDSFPGTNANPDIAVGIFNSSYIYFAETSVIDNAINNAYYSWTENSGAFVIDKENTKGQIYVGLWDVDVLTNDIELMGVAAINFSLQNGFPKEVILDYPSIAVAFKLQVKYIFL
jgi:hypothetical protein